MNFTFSISLLDPLFVALLAAAGLARWLVPKSWYVPLGVATSFALIGLGSRATLGVIAGTALLVVYPAALWIHQSQQRSAKAKAKLVMTIGILIVIALWLFIKVHKEVGQPVLGRGSMLGGALLTVLGFSYFTFRAINYLAIHYLLGRKPDGILRLLYYSLFPPTITSGPIQKYLDFSKELDAKRAPTIGDTAIAIERITKGYFFKVCLGAWLHTLSKWMLAIEQPTAYHSIATMVVLYGYFYFDFAGYSHIAIGFGRLMGITVPENFRQPFQATTIAEFWRNWHITLGDWFRDHVFIPLGGMRLGGMRATLIATMIMVISGFWHGFTWAFITWGCWHGAMIFIDGVTGLKPLPPPQRHGPRFWGRCLWTNARVAFAEIFFLKNEEIWHLLGGFTRWW